MTSVQTGFQTALDFFVPIRLFCSYCCDCHEMTKAAVGAAGNGENHESEDSR